MFSNIRPLVFWPTFSILLTAVVWSFVDLEGFLSITKGLNSWILDSFSWLFSLSSFYMLVLCVVVWFSPLGKIRIGGEHAQPLLSKPRWFMITLCTLLAVGILFWTIAEPIYHLNGTPESLGLKNGSPDAALFAMSTMFLHWTFTPYAIYAVPALTFALAFYNRRLPFSISSTLQPVLGDWVLGKGGQIIDAMALYALVAGMAATLGTGALTIAGGVGEFIDVKTSPLLLGLIIAAIVITFILSAASGLKKGIARLSAINSWLLLFIGLFVFIFGPTVYILTLGVESIGAYLSNLIEMSLFTGAAAGDKWPQWWSIFYWALWFAWAPIGALFLGKIAKGHTVKDFILVTLVYPSLFNIVWISIFSGTALQLEMAGEGGTLNKILNDLGVEKLLYHVFDQLPLSGLMTALLIFVAFISYVTAADSNTDAIGDLCTDGFTAESSEKAGLSMKVLWGSIIGVVSWTMVSSVGIDGVKMLSNLGGLPAMTIIIMTSFTLVRWINNPEILKQVPDKAHVLANKSNDNKLE